MSLTKLRILQVSSTDFAGGAERLAWNLFQAYRTHGHGSWLAVDRKRSDDPDVLPVPNDDCRCKWALIWLAIGNMLSPLIGRVRWAETLRRRLHLVGQPRRLLEIWRGHEDFEFPGTWQLLDLPPERPDIVHCHNLHGRYFDLRVLPLLCQQMSVVLTLHDAWLLSGHCAHSFDCNRWKIGCGQCPDLNIYPAIRRDATAYNWRRKQKIYGKSRLYVASPSVWLMDKVEQSMLASAIVEARVIHNGVDLTIFHPADRQEARAMLDMPQAAKVLLFVGNTTRSNPWRDYAALEQAVNQVGERLPNERIILVCLGEEQKPKRIGRAEVWLLGYQNDPVTVTYFYQAADIYLHASKADTFPSTVLEALACGTPVVATAVGGIPEQIEEGATGFLVSPGDAEGMAVRIEMLLRDEELRRQLAENAAGDARRRFDLDRQAGEYLEWYEEIVGAWRR